LNIHTHTQGTTYEVRNPGPGLGQAQTCGRVTPSFGVKQQPFIYSHLDFKELNISTCTSVAGLIS
jgi:hypothetical protein